MRNRRITRSATLGLAFAALSVPAALAQQDLRSPDTRASATPSAKPLAQDLRSPDARHATSAMPRQNLRTPDVRDVADGRGTLDAPAVTVVRAPQPAAAPDAIEWGDAGIGAGALLGLILLGLSGTVAAMHRRRGRPARSGAAPTG